MKISIKWILALTTILAVPISLNFEQTFVVVGICGALMFGMLPFVAFMRWQINDEDGWWKFEGHPIARIAVWVYAICALMIVLCLSMAALFSMTIPP